MKLMIKHSAKRRTRRELAYIAELQKVNTVYNMPTPQSDESFKQYLLDSIAWLDEGAQQ